MERVLTGARDHVDIGTALAAATLLTAGLVGVGLATSVPLGLALLLGALYLPLVFLNFPLAVCVWIPVVFLEGVPAFNLAGKAAGVLLAMGWIGALLSNTAAKNVFSRHRHLVEALVVLVVWLTLSLAWAPSVDQAATAAWQWSAVALVFVIVATSITTARMLVLAAGAYVAGAVVSVLVSAGNFPGEARADARIESSIGDPNFLAAGLVSAIPLALALSTVRRASPWRWVSFGVIVVLSVGIVASQSRGGLAAALAMWAAAFLVLARRRRQVLAVGTIVVAATATAFAFNPAAWERVTTSDRSGTGRVDLWTVAWDMSKDNPLHGVGLNNYGRVADRYVRDVGSLENVDLVVASPDRAVHNTYLQLLAENGIFALVLFVVFAVGCLRAALLAARRYAELRRPELEALAHGVFVATVGLLATGLFISNGVDRRLWIMFALGPAALEVAHRIGAGRDNSLAPIQR